MVTGSCIALAIGISISLLWTAEALASRDESMARVELEAFSVVAPSGPDWQARKRPSQFEAARLLGGDTQHTFILNAREYPPAPDSVDSVEKLQAAIEASAEKEARSQARFELKSYEVIRATRIALDCVEYRKRWIDQEAPKANERESIMVAHGLVCIHPQQRNRLIEISYSHRSSNESLPAKREQEGTRFLESLRASSKAVFSDSND